MRILFSTVHRAGVRLRHHGDFDHAGVQIFRDLEDCYDALPWRFDMDALHDSIGPGAPARRAETLEDGVRRISCALAEEMVIEDLIADLRNAAR